MGFPSILHQSPSPSPYPSLPHHHLPHHHLPRRHFHGERRWGKDVPSTPGIGVALQSIPLALLGPWRTASCTVSRWNSLVLNKTRSQVSFCCHTFLAAWWLLEFAFSTDPSSLPFRCPSSQQQVDCAHCEPEWTHDCSVSGCHSTPWPPNLASSLPSY